MGHHEKLATLGTQDTGRRQAKQKKETQTTEKLSNTDPHQKSGMNPCAPKE